MFTWLSQLPMWFQIIIVIFIFIMLIYLIFGGIIPFLKVLKNGTSFKSGDKSISFGKSRENDCIFQLKPDCPFRKDLFIFLNESSKLFNEQFTIQYVVQIKDQMNYAEQKIDQIRMKLHSIYLAELKERKATELVQNTAFISYKYLLRDIQKDIMKKLRYFFRENHFDEISESDFINYVNGKFEYLSSEVTDALNDMYYEEKEITREELYELNKKHISDIKPFVIDIFQNARNVSIDYKIKLLEINEKTENLIKRFIK